MTFSLIIFSCKTEEKKHEMFENYNGSYPPPSNQKKLFTLSQDYPNNIHNEEYPWSKINFKTHYKDYMTSVLNYCLEGNIEVDFTVQKNKVRPWYHAPWLTYGVNGREYHHGLTRERPVPVRELHPDQDIWLENWAVGFYNNPGGYTIGKVWHSDSIPNLQLANFPEGTVTFKLLYTNAPVNKVPFLLGSKEWIANIYPCNPDNGSSMEKEICRRKRQDTVLRLLQIDIAVKDSRAGSTGWVFGTYIYNASQQGNSVWDKMTPVGIMWGDDSKETNLLNQEGSFTNEKLAETVLNKSLIISIDTLQKRQAFMNHHGLGGRLNGPVDNPISSCISCHSKATITDKGLVANMANFRLTRASYTVSEFNKYFSTTSAGAGKINIEGIEYNKLDYSLQLAVGIRNFYQYKIDERNKDNKKLKQNTLNFIKEKNLPEITRNGIIETN